MPSPLSRSLALGILAALALLSPADAQVTIQPITTRPCLLSGPEDAADIRARLAIHPHPIETLLSTYLYGGEPQKQAASAQFFAYPGSGDGNGLLQTYVGQKGRRLVEDLMRYDLAVSLGYATAAQRQKLLDLATEFIAATFSADVSQFPAAGVNNGNLWLENVIALGLAGINFPDNAAATAWVTKSVAYMDYEIGAEFLDGAARETPRYHDWELLHLSNYLTVLKRRCGIDRYDSPVLRQALEWYGRFASPPVTVAGGQPILPAWGDATYAERLGKQFYVPALFAPAFKDRDPWFARRLMSWWRAAGSPDYADQAFDVTNPQLLDPRLVDSPQAARSSFYSPTLGEAILRVGSEAADEMTATFICGPPGISHENADNGHIDLFAFGVPLALDSMSGPYDTTNDTWNSRIMAHNTVRFNGTESGTSEGTTGVFNAFGSSDTADYVSGNMRYGSTSVRRVVFVKPDYLVVWDQCTASSYADFWLHTPAQSLEWQAHRVTSHTPWNVDLDVDFLLPAGALPAPTLAAGNPTADYTTRNTFASQTPAPSVATLFTTQGEGRFGEWTNPNDNSLGRNPFTFKWQPYFTVRADTSSGDFLTVWHPRKVGVTPALTASLTSSTSTSVAVTVNFDGRTDTISITTAGATVTKGGTATVQFAETFPQSGVSGAAAFVKSGYGTTTLASALATTGPVEVTMGTLALGASERIPNTAPLRLRNGGTFDLGSASETVGDLLLDGGSLIGSGTLRVADLECWGGSVSANISATGSLRKRGTAPWTLPPSVTYASGTFIDAGTLSLSPGAILPGTRNVQLGSGATLDLNGTSQTLAALAGAAGSELKIGTGTLTVSAGADSSFSGSISGTGSVVNYGTLRLVGSGAVAATVQLTNHGTLDLTAWSGTLPTSFVNNGTILGDTVPPTIAAPAGGFTPLTLTTGVGGTAPLPDYTGQAVTSDNVGVTSVTQSPAIGSAQSGGTTQVTLTAHDAAGRTAGVSFDVAVIPPPPSFTSQPQSQTAALSRGVQFVAVASGAGVVSYRWDLDGSALSDSATISGATTTTLTLSNLTLANRGSYVLVATNSGGSTSSNAATLSIDLGFASGVIASDPFTDGSLTNLYGGDLLGLTFFPQSATIAVASDAVLGSGNALQVTPTSTSARVYAEFNPVTLSNSGDYLEVQFDFRYAQAPDDVAAGLRWGFYNGGSLRPPSSVANRSDDAGYGAQTNPGGTTSGTRVFSEAAFDDILGGNAPGALVTLASGTSSNLGTTKHTAKLRLTRLASGQLQVLGTVDATTVTSTTTAVLTYVFNELALGNGATTKPYAIDNLTVSTNLDTTPPSIAAPAGGFTPTTLATAAGGTVPFPNYSSLAVASDNTAVTSVVQSPAAGSPQSVGTTWVTVTASDAAGNVAPLRFPVAITDGTAPAIGGTFSPLTLTTGSTGTAALPNYLPQIVASDNVGVASVTQSPVSDSAVGFGATPVTITAADAAGNTASTTFNVTTNDGTPPAITLLGINPATVPAESIYSDAGATAVDSVSGVVSVLRTGGVNTAVAGTYTLTFTATDAAGNVATTTRTVVVSATPHLVWKQEVFGANSSNPAISGDLADPNGNGIINLLEYALVADPLDDSGTRDASPIVAMNGSQHLTLSFFHALGRSDLTLTVQGADAPDGPWSDLAQSTAGGSFIALQGGVAISEAGPEDARNVSVSDSQTAGDPLHPQRFLRLEVAR